MTVLASYSNKTTFESEEIVIPATTVVQFFVQGHVSYTGTVKFLIRGSDMKFHEYPELKFQRIAAVELNLVEGDVVKVVFENCHDAGAEVRTL